jgi:hypothetical protein
MACGTRNGGKKKGGREEISTIFLDAVNMIL